MNGSEQVAPIERPVFDAPWQAHVFALTVALHESGLFTWPEWAAALGARLAAAEPVPPAEVGDDYYRQWTAALSDVLVARDVAGPGTLDDLAAAWHAAAARTRHGAPIVLEDADGPVVAAVRGSSP